MLKIWQNSSYFEKKIFNIKHWFLFVNRLKKIPAGDKVTDKLVKETLANYDRNHDDKLDYDEFKEFAKTILLKVESTISKSYKTEEDTKKAEWDWMNCKWF